MTTKWRFAPAVLVAVLLAVPAARAADHTDGPAASLDPAADITDVYAWTSADATRLHLVMDLVRNASTESAFSDQVQYVFHTASQSAYGAAATEVNIICQFEASQRVQCWAGDEEYLTGDASGTEGLATANNRLRVFAGLRNDPFFFNLTGFNETRRIVRGAAASLAFDAAGCPALNAATSALLVGQLRSGVGGAPPRDDFAGFNVLALVVVVDKAIVTRGGPIVSVWGSTNQR